MTIAPKPSINLGYGTGNPASTPDFRPLNPWGRPMPKPERPERPKLYQVHVRDKRNGRTIAVGPKMAHEFTEMFRLSIAQGIASGAEKRWRDPISVLMI